MRKKEHAPNGGRCGRFSAWAAALALVCALLAACGHGEAGPGVNGEMPLEASAPPTVSGPDGEGRFPAIGEQDFDRWVTSGPADAERPADTDAASFMQTPSCTRWLAENFPEIGDWQVLFENDVFSLREGMYDPYRYQWRDQWAQNRLTVLSTGESDQFDRIVLVSIDQVAVLAGSDEAGNGLFCPQQETLIYYCTGWADQLQMGDFSGAQALYLSDNNWYPSLYWPEQDRALLLDFNMQEIIPVDGADPDRPMVIFISDPVTAFFPELAERAGDKLVWLHHDSDMLGQDLYYYDAKTQRLSPFEGCTGTNPQLFPLSGSVLALQCEDRVCLYDLSSKQPSLPEKVLGGGQTGGALTEGEVWIMYQLATERGRPDNHVMMYYVRGEDLWRICTFTTAGEILSNFSTGLAVTEDYIGSITYAQGLVYFTYYPQTTASSNRFHYCVDARPGYNHTLQVID